MWSVTLAPVRHTVPPCRGLALIDSWSSWAGPGEDAEQDREDGDEVEGEVKQRGTWGGGSQWGCLTCVCDIMTCH